MFLKVGFRILKKGWMDGYKADVIKCGCRIRRWKNEELFKMKMRFILNVRGFRI